MMPLHETTGPTRAGLADILEKIADTINYFCKLPHPDIAMLLACWIANTYTYELFRYCGYVALRSATPRCGKTRVLELIGGFARGAPPIMTLPTPAIIFRTAKSDVLLFDEVDALGERDKKAHTAVLQVLNGGFQRGTIVKRMSMSEKKKGELETFETYGPKVIAGIESLADTLSDRTFTIQMTRSAERTPRLRLHKPGWLEIVQAATRERLATWAKDNEAVIRAGEGELPNEHPDLRGYDDRFQDISEPLIVLATLADRQRDQGPAILPRLLSGLHETAGRRSVSGKERSFMAFLRIVETYLKGGNEVFVSSSRLLEACRENDHLSWIDSFYKLATFLEAFDLAPGSDGKCRGYLIRQQWVEEWWGRYQDDSAA